MLWNKINDVSIRINTCLLFYYCFIILGVEPGLAVVLVGERKDSATYVRMKKKACEEVGIRSFGIGKVK